MSLSVVQRILIGFGSLLALLLVVAAVSISGSNTMQQHLKTVTGDVANITTESTILNDQLALSNIAVLRYLVTKAEQDLEAPFNQYTQGQTGFSDTTVRLNDALTDHPELVQTLQQIQTKSSGFFDTAEFALKNHKHSIQLQQELANMKLDWIESLEFGMDDLTAIESYPESKEQEFAASYIRSQLSSLIDLTNDYFDLTDLGELASMRTEMTKGFARIGDLSQKLNDGDMNSLLTEFIDNLQSDDGVVNAHYTFNKLNKESESAANRLMESMQQLQQHSAQLLADVSAIRVEARDDAMLASQLSRSVTYVSVVISIIAALIVALWVSRSIRTPLAEVMRVLGDVAKGDFTQHSNVKTKDEFGELSKWVNSLVARLKDVMQQVSEASGKVENAAHQTHEIAETSQHLMSSQNEKTTGVASAMTEMAATVNEVAKNAENSLNKIQSVDKNAEESRDKMQHNIDEVEKLVAQLEHSTTLVNNVNEHSKNIDQILEVIQGIAEQTNLLALNAAIEAARAGEQGRGFAVVADEVRTLATRTHQSTEEIQTVIQQLQKGVKETVVSMEQCRNNAYTSMDEARNVGTTLDSLRSMMSDIRDLSMQIATAAEQQSLVAQEINQSVHEISDSSETASAEALKGQRSSLSMTELAAEQMQLVAQFKTQ
ncbi:methyl-accepting chemotaxis protein [Marinomonas mediterranea]|jgi:Methyl-accepting chemotaxis protein|uniref:Methyl-accepting chemotaxis sensory transducer n=1 Tax=Marinomonas mediterranea (strain ATCC 700492 / JCM 21426 / NBRC 103028 / MMB-1) TaxID=717774 RepID=F2JYL3_MARM1|nr:methyl-accepting chemotaxis protein [Marinomonas mediterranea]ADZ93142.1 methyl-accepting chemotaxis sensory transducer [Marinomonas mediterranea MMB-1]WCN19150.1 HAMP domain-containing protein [Marinomonas mediterranea MMB-1]